MKKSTKAQLREKAEKVLLSKSENRPKDNRPQNDLVHELQVHQIELEMQNDELRETKARLEEISAKYLDLYELAPVGYVIFDNEWIILEANLTGTRMLGTTKSQIISKPLHVFIDPEFQDAFHFYRRKLQKSGNSETCELKLKNNIFISLESINVLDGLGGSTGMIRSVFTNITERRIVEVERKRAEELLRKEMLRLEIAQESAQAGTFEWDIQENKTIWSDQLKALYGFAPGEFKGFENWSSRVHPDDLRKAKKDILESLTTGKYDSDFRVIWPDGSLHWLAARGRVLYNGQGLPILMTGINIDITTRKQAEEALQHYQEELENKVRERTTQLAEINESLMAEIEERKRTEKRLRSAQKNLRAMAAEIVMADERSRQHFAADLHDTVIQTIGAAKLRGQLIQDEIPEKSSKIFQELQGFISQSITQARFIMAELSPPVLNELGFMAAIEWLTEQIENQHGISIEFQAKNGLAPLQHEIQVLLFHATRELLMNIVKHAKADKALVKIYGNKQKVRIEVKDNGGGFDKRQAFRTDVSSGGFGLFSIRERIRHFGGHLFIQSEEGKGTRVVVTAPHTRGGGGDDSYKAKETNR